MSFLIVALVATLLLASYLIPTTVNADEVEVPIDGDPIA